jgi:GTP cyclohydrolase I
VSKLKYANGNRPLTEQEKEKMIKEAAEHYGRYMTSLGFDWKNDPNSSDTPMRVAKAFVNDLAEGVYSKSPKITAFDLLVMLM